MNNTAQILGVIPARYASTRFPAKPLVDIGGKSMIQRVYEQAKKCKALTDVVVATDHEEIKRAVSSFGGHAVMTKESHQSGTDRCFETLMKTEQSFDYVVNIQGDEPFINPKQILELTHVLDGTTELATLVKQIDNEKDLFNPNVVKVVVNTRNEAIYFSRSTIPYNRQKPKTEWHKDELHFKHIGIYAYRVDILEKITQLPPSILEKTESLEQLRWIENSFTINVAKTTYESVGIDTPEDLEKVRNFY